VSDPTTDNRQPATVYVLVGATAGGKTAVAVELARLLGAELASLDSMKVYRGMDLGTAKPSAAERRGLRWHLLDLVGPGEDFSVGRWLEAADRAIADCAAREVPLVFEGGSPLYYRALTEGLFSGPPADRALRGELEAFAAERGVEQLHAELAAVDPAAAARIGERDLRRIVRALEVQRTTGRPISAMQHQFGRRRPGFDFRVAGVRRPREEIYARIDRRVEEMMAAGLLEEVRSLRSLPGGLSRSALQALGYRELERHLDGESDLAEAVRLVKRNTRHFARRQLNWFGKMAGIAWFDPSPGETPGELAGRIARELGPGPGGPLKGCSA
jgi:tRNA dimethylallyltransferase